MSILERICCIGVSSRMTASCIDHDLSSRITSNWHRSKEKENSSPLHVQSSHRIDRKKKKENKKKNRSFFISHWFRSDRCHCNCFWSITTFFYIKSPTEFRLDYQNFWWELLEWCRLFTVRQGAPYLPKFSFRLFKALRSSNVAAVNNVSRRENRESREEDNRIDWRRIDRNIRWCMCESDRGSREVFRTRGEFSS